MRPSFTQRVRETLMLSLVITTRDYSTFEALKPYKPVHLPCPALFCAPSERTINDTGSIGLF